VRVAVDFPGLPRVTGRRIFPQALR